MSHDLLKIDFPQIYHAVSISNDIKETVCSLRLPFSSGFDRSQHYDSEVSRVFNKMLRILCEDLNELNINLKTGAQDIENADEGERQKYRFPWQETPGSRSKPDPMHPQPTEPYPGERGGDWTSTPGERNVRERYM